MKRLKKFQKGVLIPSKVDFEKTRNCLMLKLFLLNAKRAGDVINMRIEEFECARSTKHDSLDHIVHVREHKTSTSKLSPINFHGKFYTQMTRYLATFKISYLQPTGYMFPHVTNAGVPRRMNQSQLNVAIKRTWVSFRNTSATPELLPLTLCTSFIRKSTVTTLYGAGADVDMQNSLAVQMAHDPSTARLYYDGLQGLTSSSAGTSAIRQRVAGSSRLNVDSSQAIDIQPELSASGGEAHFPLESTGKSTQGGKSNTLPPHAVSLLIQATAAYRKLVLSGEKQHTGREVLDILRENGGEYAKLVKELTAKQIGDRVAYQLRKEGGVVKNKIVCKKK